MIEDSVKESKNSSEGEIMINRHNTLEINSKSLNSSKFNYADIEKVSNFLDSVIKRMNNSD